VLALLLLKRCILRIKTFLFLLQIPDPPCLLYLKGSLEKSRVYTAPDMWYEEIYQGGEVFLRITYREEEKVKKAYFGL